MKRVSRLVVVKVGSGLLTDRRGGIDLIQIQSLADQIAELRKKKIQTILVSSGSISSGMTVLGLKKRPTDLSMLQACSTVGQPRLIRAYEEAFLRHGMCVAQILLTNWDLDSRKLYQNTQATLQQLLRLGNCVPIFNENDALSFKEIEMLNTFGDNDNLSAHVALLSGASRLIILSSIDGLRTKKDGSGKLIRQVSVVDKKIESYAGKTRSERSVGGMVSKLETAKWMLKENIPMVIANGRETNVLPRIIKGERLGTWFQEKNYK